MPRIDSHAPGSFCWFELATTDQAAAKQFYSSLFGWTANDFPMGPDAYYTMFRLQDRDAGAAYGLDAEQRARHVPPHWNIYVAVADADATAAKAAALGATLIAPPFDVMSFGRMAVIQDPGGAVFSIWQPRDHHGTGIGNEPSTACWCELATHDAGKMGEFYGALFGWGRKDSASGHGYTEWMLDGQPIGGMLPMQAEWGDIPSHWMVYFLVADCAASFAKARELGATAKVPPTPIPQVGTFALLADGQGAHFSIIQLHAM